MQQVKYLTGLLLSGFVLAGCVNSRIYMPYTPLYGPTPAPDTRQTDNTFDYERKPIHLKNKVLTKDETAVYEVRYLRFPSIGINGQKDNLVTAEYYQSKHPGKKKLVMILPIWGSYTYPSNKISEGIRARSGGYTNVLQILGGNYLFDWTAMRKAASEEAFVDVMQRMAERMRTSVIDIRRFIDWAETQPDIDSKRIGLIGFSMSALSASVALVNEPRISAGVLVMGAANSHEIFATCPGKAGEVRESILKRFGWTTDRYRDTLEEIFGFLNPVRFSGRVDPSQVIIFDAHRDECMPATARDALWNAMGRPERISFLYKHKISFLSMTPLGSNYMRRKIYEFLDKTL